MKQQIFSLALLLITLTSCMNQPSAPINYGTGENSSSNKYSVGDSDDIVERPIIHEKTTWGNKEVENTEDKNLYPDQDEPAPMPLADIPLRAKTILHEVIEGETIDTIAVQYGIDRDDIIKANKLKSPYKLEELQILKIPPQTTNDGAAVGDVITPGSIVTPAVSRVSSILPVNGSIISKFGDSSSGVKNNGINIASPLGTNIQSSSTGKVVYAGTDPRFGNLVIVKSENKEIFMAYSHMSDMLLKQGDLVSKGQIIGHVGQTGNVTSPQLHFAVRQGRTPIDPEKYLAGQ